MYMSSFAFRMYAIFAGDAKPRNKLEAIAFKMWVCLGVSPGRLSMYEDMKDKL